MTFLTFEPVAVENGYTITSAILEFDCYQISIILRFQSFKSGNNEGSDPSYQ